jgi:hypothetical protein
MSDYKWRAAIDFIDPQSLQTYSFIYVGSGLIIQVVPRTFLTYWSEPAASLYRCDPREYTSDYFDSERSFIKSAAKNENVLAKRMMIAQQVDDAFREPRPCFLSEGAWKFRRGWIQWACGKIGNDGFIFPPFIASPPSIQAQP